MKTARAAAWASRSPAAPWRMVAVLRSACNSTAGAYIIVRVCAAVTDRDRDRETGSERQTRTDSETEINITTGAGIDKTT
eukprot:3126553-Rhodomonas_salina.2